VVVCKVVSEVPSGLSCQLCTDINLFLCTPTISNKQQPVLIVCLAYSHYIAHPSIHIRALPGYPKIPASCFLLLDFPIIKQQLHSQSVLGSITAKYHIKLQINENKSCKILCLRFLFRKARSRQPKMIVYRFASTFVSREMK